MTEGSWPTHSLYSNRNGVGEWKTITNYESACSVSHLLGVRDLGNMIMIKLQAVCILNS